MAYTTFRKISVWIILLEYLGAFIEQVNAVKASETYSLKTNETVGSLSRTLAKSFLAFAKDCDKLT